VLVEAATSGINLVVVREVRTARYNLIFYLKRRDDIFVVPLCCSIN
jgi:hypothetical protein